MRLSVCCLTDDPPAQVEATLQPLRQVTDEVVIAADARVSAVDRRAYGKIADRVVRCEFEYFERHLAWLHEQCRGEWVLRVDTDEVVSGALVDELPQILDESAIQQCSFPRRWLDTTGSRWYDELPWAPDYQTRLVRRRSATFPGVPHSNVERRRPARFSLAPLYHAVCALEDVAARQKRVAYHDGLRPALRAPGGGPFNATYYLPELHASREPIAVPEADGERVASLLATRDLTPAVESSPRGAAAADRVARPRPGSRVELLERDLRFYPGEMREVHVMVQNGESRPWPGGLEAEPRVRLSYRWNGDDGSFLGEGPRSPLPEAVPPGTTRVAPLVVSAPAERGRSRLTIDLVEEDVRWLDAGATHEVEVAG